MQAEVIKTFHFSAAHSLAKAPDGHKCRRLHGHNYRVDIHVTGSFDNEQGWVMDFGRIKRIVGPVLDKLDHRCLNDIADLGNSTSEHLAKYLWEKILADLPGLSAITVWESQSSRCVYRGE
ncbi:MAG: 6-carboxytetrahydropterin synthase QueD [Planctomycetes bacterium]|nr:6-carboxytetrahydropterin synthase QueD [Planctomycetota bacterium]